MYLKPHTAPRKKRMTLSLFGRMGSLYRDINELFDVEITNKAIGIRPLMIKSVTFSFSRKINRKMAATINLVHYFELKILSCKAGGESELATRTHAPRSTFTSRPIGNSALA